MKELRKLNRVQQGDMESENGFRNHNVTKVTNCFAFMNMGHKRRGLVGSVLAY